jgi:hypothetical protein
MLIISAKIKPDCESAVRRQVDHLPAKKWPGSQQLDEESGMGIQVLNKQSICL